MDSSITLQANDDSLIVNVPLKLKKRGGRKEVILGDISSTNTYTCPTYQEPMVIAIARAYRWQKLLDEGKFESISNLAREIGLDPCYAARIFRLTLLAPDIVEMILVGKEPSGLSLKMLAKATPLIWDAQRMGYGVRHLSR
ncbi:MAG: hypothetical protein ACYC27_12420 [Armatimonadota bacterium]